MNGFVLAGTASGTGKTVATLAVIRALQDAGATVQPAKAGPDFIDPSHHEVAANRPSRTLDVWLEGVDGARRNYHRGRGDVCVVEGVMGLYDGECSSTAAVAESLDLPVILVVDASASMESVGATALGFRDYAKQAGYSIDVVGIIAQRAGGGRHERGIRESLPEGIEYFGRIPARDELSIPSRHLGLEGASETTIDTAVLDEISVYLRPRGMLEVARSPPSTEPLERSSRTEKRIAVATGEAFRFVYPAVSERLRERADVFSFDPTAGDDLPHCDGVYLPGGYPELFAEELADSPALASMHEVATEGRPILGECGGMMVLSESLTTTDGETFSMAGVLPADVEMHERYQALDHVELRANRETLTARMGASIRGHEFHYSRVRTAPDAEFAFEVERGTGMDGDHDGLLAYSTLGTYSHVHAESNAFDRFVDTL